MLLVRTISSVTMALVITAIVCLLAPSISSKREAISINPVQSVQIQSLPEPQPPEQKNVLKLHKPLQLPKTPQKRTPKQQPPENAVPAMSPLRMELPRLRASTLPATPPKAPTRVTGGFSPGGIFNAGEVDTPPRLQKFTQPLYPSAARGKKIEGRVMVRCIVTARGRVKDPQVISSKPQGYFEKAAIRAVKKWTFLPAKLRGDKVPVYVDIPLTFSLD